MKLIALALALLLSIPASLADEDAPTAYKSQQIRGWTVQVHPDLLAAPDDLGKRVLELLDHRLFEARRVLPKEAVTKLEKVTIWMDLKHKEVPGGVYHPSKRWLELHDYDPRLAESVHFGNAKNFLEWSHSQPSMVLHELSHAYHHQFLGHGQEDIAKAYEAAKDSGKYSQVLRNNGSREVAYAMNNDREYFAELTEAYFGVNDFFPFVRVELSESDREGFQAVKKVWGD